MPVEMVGIKIGLACGKTKPTGRTLDASVESFDNFIMAAENEQRNYRMTQ